MFQLKSFRFIFIILIFLLSLFWLFLLVKCAPQLESIRANSTDKSQSDSPDSLQFPSNLNELQGLSKLLQQYNKVNAFYVIILFSSAYLFKQTFAIPGSVFMNLLGGALYGLYGGFILCCILTASGATFCYLLSKYFGRVYIIKYFPKRIDFLKRKITENRSRLIYMLLFLRLFPMTPNWFLNMASPIIDIPIHLFSFSVFIGLMPYNYICVQMGCLLSQLNSLDDVLTMDTIIKLAMIALVALIPGILLKPKRKKLN